MSIGDHGHVDREWRDRWDEAVSSICRGISGEMVVIGEETQIKGLGWELPRGLWASSLVLISKARGMHWWMRRSYSSESSIVTFLSMLSLL